MRIGFDAKRAVQNHTGLGNYSRHLIETLAEARPDCECLLFAPKRKNNHRLAKIMTLPNVKWVFPQGAAKFFSALWRIWGITKTLKKRQIDIFHGCSNELPLSIAHSGIKSVVTIHDLIFLRYPQYYKAIDRAIYRLKLRLACRNACRIIAVSQCTKADLIALMDVPASKIDVVYQGCHSSFGVQLSDTAKAEVTQKYGLPPDFLLNVGSIEPRKNLLAAVKALERLPERIHLAAVGRRTPYQDEATRYAHAHNLASRLHILNGVPFADLPALYQGAAVFVYPSFFEGFGIPVLEALASGTPVVAATGSCLEEAGGAHSLYVNPHSSTELADAIAQIIGSPHLAAQMSARGREYAARFSPQNIADALMRIYTAL